jgi:hypothetical protein
MAAELRQRIEEIAALVEGEQELPLERVEALSELMGLATLRQIEDRLGRFCRAAAPGSGILIETASERACQQRREALLLYGPQRRGEAIEQSAVDALLAD